jgi:hypothetical protein
LQKPYKYPEQHYIDKFVFTLSTGNINGKTLIAHSEHVLFIKLIQAKHSDKKFLSLAATVGE